VSPAGPAGSGGPGGFPAHQDLQDLTELQETWDHAAGAERRPGPGPKEDPGLGRCVMGTHGTCNHFKM